MKRCCWKTASLVGGFVALALASVGVSSATANTITVANTNDSGAGSLRQAIADANPGDTISVPGSASHYAVTSGDLAIGKNLTLNGGGARTTVIDAMNGSNRVLEITAGTVAISGVTITGGKLTGDGGGIEIDNGASLTLSGSSVSGNTVGAGGGDGGGIEADGNLTVNASTIANNVGYNGGGIDVGATTTITDSTISGNQAGDSTNNGDGGAMDIGAGGNVTLVNDTIANNESFNGLSSGGGVDGSLVAVKNTIIANNTDNTGGVDNCDGAEPSTGPNLENGITCAFAADGGISAASVPLGALADNGGPTDTLAPPPDSFALDRATNSGCPATDQRGGARPQPPGGTCDIGAFEYGSLADLAVSQSVSPSPVAADTTLTYALTVTNTGPGPDPAAGVTLQDVLPAGAALLSSSTSQGSCVGVPVACAFGTLASGASAQVTIAVRPTLAGTATNTATVSAIPTDPNPANNVSQLQTSVLAVPPAPPQLTSVSFGNQRITLTSPSLRVCTASTKTLGVSLSSTAIAKSKAAKLKFTSAVFYLDKGVKHTKRKTVRAHGKTKTVTVITYTANATAHHVPVALALKLAGLKTGTHTLTVKLSYKQTKTKRGRKTTVTVSKTLKAKFLVC